MHVPIICARINQNINGKYKCKTRNVCIRRFMLCGTFRFARLKHSLLYSVHVFVGLAEFCALANIGGKRLFRQRGAPAMGKPTVSLQNIIKPSLRIIDMYRTYHSKCRKNRLADPRGDRERNPATKLKKNPLIVPTLITRTLLRSYQSFNLRHCLAYITARL